MSLQNSTDNDPTELNGHVLSIQSHVAHGYVGNRAAVFPLQLLGFEVDFINSVQFSNHTGYPTHNGEVLTGEELTNIFEGLKSNNLHENYTHMLTGYIGNASFLNKVLSILKELRSIHPDMMYVCDPVLGDDGEFYTPKENVAIYRDQVIPLADVVTPNQFEAELLSGITIKTEEDVKQILNWFHSKGVKTVVITSVFFPEKPDELTLYASKIDKNDENTTKKPKKEPICENTEELGDNGATQLKITFKKLPGYFTGTGDIITSLILAWSTIHKDNLKLAVEKALSTVQKILMTTKSGEELNLIPNRLSIMNPVVRCEAKQL